MINEYRMCTRCVMDTTANDIVFDEKGVCNYCTEFLERSSHVIFQNPEARRKELEDLVERVFPEPPARLYESRSRAVLEPPCVLFESHPS